MRLNRKQRRGGSLVEFAIVGSITALILFALFIGCMGIFRYQQVAAISRETARYASVHGARYAEESGSALPGKEDIYRDVIAPRATLLNLNKLTYSIEWNTDQGLNHRDPSSLEIIPNTVTVTVSYEWKPELFLGSITLRSTSVATMSH